MAHGQQRLRYGYDCQILRTIGIKVRLITTARYYGYYGWMVIKMAPSLSVIQDNNRWVPCARGTHVYLISIQLRHIVIFEIDYTSFPCGICIQLFRKGQNAIQVFILQTSGKRGGKQKQAYICYILATTHVNRESYICCNVEYYSIPRKVRNKSLHFVLPL